MIAYLQDLGVSAVELLPVHQSLTNGTLSGRGLTNYWGYDTIGFFALNGAYSSARRAGGSPGSEIDEFKAMVKALHGAGIAVILDVVFNHTAEGNEHGPTLCFRGIDNAAYYQLVPGRPQSYDNLTGTGNTMDAASPMVRRLIMDSLRYWVDEMHVDGFRFDLGAVLGSDEPPSLADADPGWDVNAAFFDLRAAGSDPGPHQADRRALDRSRKRARPVPSPLVGVERSVSRCHAGLLARPGIKPAMGRRPNCR